MAAIVNTSDDAALTLACEIVSEAMANNAARPTVESFFDTETSSFSHVVHDRNSAKCAIVDSVLNFDAASGRTSTASADRLVDYISADALKCDWQFETHVHADHLSAAPYLRERLGARIGIGERVMDVQSVFGEIMNAGPDLKRDGSQFDALLRDGETFFIGETRGCVLHVPGHTPADVAYVIGDTVFVGDTLFMPDLGTARADFPGGDARQLYRSVSRILALPPETRVFLCHDYVSDKRPEPCCVTTISAQRRDNIHVGAATSEDAFVELRTKRDATLGMPKLMLPAVQVNMRAGNLPDPEDNGRRYLKIPVDTL